MLLRDGEQLVFDCGEGCQRQMVKAGIGLRKNLKIFITHMHADHVLGLAGMLMTMSLMGRQDPLDVFGPPGIARFVECLMEVFGFNPDYEVNLHQVSSGVICRGRGYRIEAFEVNHSVPSYGYALVEDDRPGKFDPKKALELGVPRGPLWKALQRGEAVNVGGRVVRPEDVMGPPRRGLKVVYTGDTAPTRSVIEVARGADLLIHDATFDDSLEELAREELHSTARQAAQVALEAGVKLLVLTHISPRYEDTSQLLAQARSVFSNSLVAEDFMELTLRWED